MPIDLSQFKKKKPEESKEIKKEEIKVSEEIPKEIPKIKRERKPKIKIENIEEENQEQIAEIEVNKIMEDLAKTSDFKRLIYIAITGESHRKTTKNLNQKLNYYLKQVRKI